MSEIANLSDLYVNRLEDFWSADEWMTELAQAAFNFDAVKA